MATNRADTLDPALLRPGRLDRKIEFPLPSRREKRLIFQTITSKMNLGPDVDLEDCEPRYQTNRSRASLDKLSLQTSPVQTNLHPPKSLPYVRPEGYKVRVGIKDSLSAEF